MRKVKVICPNCGCIVEGEVTSHIWDNHYIDGYYAHCDKCDYEIMESEWDEVKILPFDNSVI